MALHSDLTGSQALHQIAQHSESDPGSIGAYKAWLVPSTGVLSIRNSTNTGWIAIGDGGISGDLTAHINDTSDAHDASAISFVPAGTIAATNAQAAIEEVASEAAGSVADASETVKGKIEIATQGETDTGTDDVRAITPLKLANYSGLSGGGGHRTLLQLSSDAASTTTTPADLTGLSFAVSANVAYRWEATLAYAVSAFTSGLIVRTNGPGTPTYAVYWIVTTTSAGAPNGNISTGFGASLSFGQSNDLTHNIAVFHGIFKTPTSGTFQLQFGNEQASTTLTVKAGSCMEYY